MYNMSKVIKRIYLPSGLVASMYNLYMGKGNDSILSTYDVEILNSFIEYYFNYTEPEKKNYIYKFYTLPHFYTSKKNREQDELVLVKDRALRDRYCETVRDYYSLGSIANSLIKQKMNVLNGLQYNPYKMAAILGEQSFRLGDLYEKGLFNTTIAEDMSVFYELKNKNARSNMGDMQFCANEAELKTFLNEYFNSYAYKAVEEIEEMDISGHFAPSIDIFVDCFKKAAEDFSKLGFEDMNKKYEKEISGAAQGIVDIEIR